MRLISKAFNACFSLFAGLSEQQWWYVLTAVMVLGFFMMRGFGSRKNY